MIWSLIVFIILIMGILCLFLEKKTTVYEDLLDAVGITLSVLGFFGICVVIVILLIAHSGVDSQIQQYELEYNSLYTRLECIDSDYEDVSKTELINDIVNWNKRVISSRYWSDSPWTNWFYDKKVVSTLKEIPLDLLNDKRRR